MEDFFRCGTQLSNLWCHLYEPVFMAMPKLLLTEFGIHHRLDFFGWCKTRAQMEIHYLEGILSVSSPFSGNVSADRDTWALLNFEMKTKDTLVLDMVDDRFPFASSSCLFEGRTMPTKKSWSYAAATTFSTSSYAPLLSCGVNLRQP